MGTVPVPYSPVAGDDATQARVLTWADAAAYLLGNATSGGSSRPLCVLRQTVASSTANGAFTAVAFDTEDVDRDNGHSTVTNTSRYTAVTAGWYLVTGAGGVVANATGFRRTAIRINGVTVKVVATGSALAATASDAAVACKVFLNVNDYVELVVFQNSGGALNTNLVDAGATMSVEWRSN